jgi:hypothetical protein
MANTVLTRARKERFPSQRDFGQAIAEKLRASGPDGERYPMTPSYAQKKASLWESGQLKPTPDEMRAMSGILELPLAELEESFSTGVLPCGAGDLLRNLAPGQGLIAACFTGRVKPKLFPEDETALREALGSHVRLAIFFPFPLDSASPAKAEYAEALNHHHRDAWRSVVKFWKLLRSFVRDANPTTVKLYHPRVKAANILFPPIFHRPTLLCERAEGRTKVDLYSWTQGKENDGFYKISDRSVEDADLQAEAWELFFGGVYAHWNDTGELPDGDTYWQAYTGQSETEVDQ